MTLYNNTNKLLKTQRKSYVILTAGDMEIAKHLKLPRASMWLES